MADRSLRIISQVRHNLGQISEDKLKTREIFNRANYIQSEILRETKCNKIEIDIITKSGVGGYDLNNKFLVMNVVNWDGISLKFIKNDVWNEYSDTGSNSPLWFTVFGNKLLVKPIPLSNNKILKVWAYQLEYNIAMDADIDPEIPEYADRCLIYGINAEFMPEKYYILYEEAKLRVALTAHNNVAINKESELYW